LQNYGQPIPIITADSKNVTDAEKNEMTDYVEHLQDNMYLYLPGDRPKNKKSGDYSEKILSKFQVDLLEVKHENGTDQYERTIDQLDRQISRKMLIPDKMGFTSDKSGARAQAQVELDVLKMVIKDLHGRLEDVANEIIIQLTDLNFPGVEEYTTWQFEKVDEKIEQEMLKVLLDKDVIDKREAWIRTYTGIPTLSEEEQIEIDKQKEEDRKKALADDQARQPAFGAPVNGIPFGPPKADTGPQKQKLKNTVDYKKIEEQYDTAEADFVRDFTRVHKVSSESLIRQIERKKIIENKDLSAIKKLGVNKRNFLKLMSLYYAKLYIEGKASAIEEIKGRIPTNMAVERSYLDGIDWLDRTWIDKYLSEYGELGIISAADNAYLATIRDRSFFVTGDIEQRMLKDVHDFIVSGLDNGLTAKTIISQIDSALAADRKKYAITIARTNASTAFNTGRMNFFTSDNIRPLIEAYQYSAIIDNVTCLAEGTKIETSKGFKSIEDVRIGEKVLTTHGFEKVKNTLKKHYDKTIHKISANGKDVYCTWNHPFYTKRGWIQARDLRDSDIIIQSNPNVIAKICRFFYFLFAKSYKLETIFNKKYFFGLISFFIPVPISSINLYTQKMLRNIKINTIPTDFSLLHKIKFIIGKAFSDFGFKGCFTSKFAIARDGTKSFGIPHFFQSVSTNSTNRESLPASKASNISRFSESTLARTENAAFCLAYTERFPTPFTVNKYNLLMFAGQGAVIIPTGVTPGDGKGFFTANTYFSNSLSGIPAFHGTVKTSILFDIIKRAVNNFTTRFTSYIDSCFRSSHNAIMDNIVKNVKDNLLYVYDLTIENKHEYFANGFLVHNTDYCETHDGQIIYPNDPTFGLMQPPNHFNCRSLLIPIMTGEGQIPESPYYGYETELDKWGTGVAPTYRLPAEGFGGIARAEGGWG
jgi:intein/homing endonuclease